MTQRSRYCRRCAKHTLHVRPSAVGGLGCLVILLTLGLAIPFFILNDALTPYRCQQCGKGRMT